MINWRRIFIAVGIISFIGIVGSSWYFSPAEWHLRNPRDFRECQIVGGRLSQPDKNREPLKYNCSYRDKIFSGLIYEILYKY
jgi:hypothetical protein